MLQLTYLGYTCGAAVSPAITRFFLVPFDDNQFNRTSSSYSTDLADSFVTTSPSFELTKLTGNGIQLENHWQENDAREFHAIAKLSIDVVKNVSQHVGIELLESIELVRFAFAAVIPVYVVVALWFVLMVCCDKRVKTVAAESKLDSAINKPAESRFLKTLLLALMALFYVTAIIHEAAILTLITPIAIKSWEWAVQTAALTSSIIMIGYLIGRLLCMFMSAFIDPIIMLAAAIALLLFGTIQLLISQYSTTTNNVVILSSLVILGLGQSALSAVNLFLISKYVTMTPAVSSLYLISLSIGWMLASSCGSRIYETFGHMTVFWILLVLAVLVLLFFVMEVIVGKLILKDKLKKGAYITNNNHDMNEEGKSLNT